jgi:hypothetical protein
MKRIQLAAGLGCVLFFSLFAQIAEARTYWSFGIRLGVPAYGYYGPRYYSYPYYAPGPYMYEAPPIVVRPGPYIVESPPAVTILPPSNAVPPPPASPAPSPYVVPAQNVSATAADALLQRLNDANETVRRDAAMDLGRMKAQRAVDPLVTLLAKDPSANVRDAAARALGLIASPRSLNALIYAAQADNDRDVRHSAQFAVEIIRTNLRGN